MGKSRSKYYGIALVVLLVALMAAMAVADTVIVRPSAMQGWRVAVRNSLDETPAPVTQPTWSFVTNSDAPNGAFYCETGSGGAQPDDESWGDIDGCGMVWLGTNEFQHIFLNAYEGIDVYKLDKLEYRVFTYYDGNLPDNVVRSPIRAEVRCEKQGWWGRWFMNRPWGDPAPPGTFPLDPTHLARFGKWETFDALAPGAAENLWIARCSETHKGTWQYVSSFFPESVRLDQPYKGAYMWNRDYNGTGTSLTLVAGSYTRDGKYAGDYNPSPSWLFPEWWTEQRNFRGMLDSVTVGWRRYYNGTPIEPYMERTFKFRPDEPGEGPLPAVAMNCRSAFECGHYVDRNKFRVALFGRVINVDNKMYPETSYRWFYIDDGTGPMTMGNSVRVLCDMNDWDPHVVYEGDYVRCVGYLSDAIMNRKQPELLCEPEDITTLVPVD